MPAKWVEDSIDKNQAYQRRKQQQEEQAMAALLLEMSIEQARQFILTHPDLFLTIRKTLSEVAPVRLGPRSKEKLPMDGDIKIPGHTPVFIENNSSKINYSVRYAAPGMKYSISVPEVFVAITVIVTLCKKDSDVYAIVHLSNVDGFTHKNNWSVTCTANDQVQLEKWLKDNISLLLSGQHLINEDLQYEEHHYELETDEDDDLPINIAERQRSRRY